MPGAHHFGSPTRRAEPIAKPAERKSPTTGLPHAQPVFSLGITRTPRTATERPVVGRDGPCALASPGQALSKEREPCA
jgi:hypothetical protein